MRVLFYIVVFFLWPLAGWSQDPHFTQANAAPFSINPAYTGVFMGNARVMTNYRQQWANVSTPFTTASLSADFKIAKDPSKSQNPLNVGMQVMTDRSMKGAFSSNYFTATASYHVPVNWEATHSVGLGLSGTYGNRRIDFSSLSFEEQFASSGFDLQLPTGEQALQNMKPFVTVGAGILYSFQNQEEGTFFDLGVSGYHFNKPKQTVLADPKEYLSIRYSAQANFQRYLNNSLLLSVRSVYQTQAGVDYMQIGVSAARLMDPDNTNTNMIGGGIWYRTGDAVSPHVFMEFNQMQIGVSYDVGISDLRKRAAPARSLELSLIWRIGNDDPWDN
jgi:type IX secretion system PorP/SprF family membrane protein